MASFWSWLVPSPDRLPARSYVALAILTLLLHLPGQAGIPPMDRDEARYIQATRQMLASGDFVDIRFGDEVRYLQPAGIYWLQSLAAAPFGGDHAPVWAYRLPSLLAALASVLITAWFAARLGGATVGLGAGLLLAMSLMLTVEAHFAKIDAALLLATLVAQAALYNTLIGAEKPKFIGWPLVFWLALGAGGMLKGPIIFMVVGLTAIAFAAWQRDWGAVLKLRPLIGVPLAAAVIAPWLIAISVKSNGLFLQEALGFSLGAKLTQGEKSHGGPPGYHLALLALTFFPGIVLIGLAALEAWRERLSASHRFLIAWIVPAWLMFELVGTKLPHYTLPVFPALATLASLALASAKENLAMPRARTIALIGPALFLIAALAFTAVPIVAAHQVGESVTPIVVAASLAGVFVLAAGIYLIVRKSHRALLQLAGALVIANWLLFQFVVPGFENMWVSKRLGGAVAALEGCDEKQVAIAGYSEPSAFFYFGAKTVAADGTAVARWLAANPACGVALVDSSEADAFAAAAAGDVRGFGRVTAFNYEKGDPITIDIVVAPESRLH